MGTSRRTPQVAVYGSSAADPSSEIYRRAMVLGRRLAEGGANVSCGGYGGVMEAVSRGAVAAGGRAIGYTVSAWSHRRANRFLSEECPCDDLYERLRHLIDDSDAMIALGGGIGTLVEVTLAWNQIFMNLIEPRPLLVVGKPWRMALGQLRGFLEIHDRHMAHVRLCTDVEEAVRVLEAKGILE